MNTTQERINDFKAITVLGDGETSTDLRDTKVMLLSKDFECDLIDSASDFYNDLFVFEDGAYISSLIVEELSIQTMVEFYLANRK
jgi:hypothetical protein